jgi:hypothetical protein
VWDASEAVAAERAAMRALAQSGAMLGVHALDPYGRGTTIETKPQGGTGEVESALPGYLHNTEAGRQRLVARLEDAAETLWACAERIRTRARGGAVAAVTVVAAAAGRATQLELAAEAVARTGDVRAVALLPSSGVLSRRLAGMGLLRAGVRSVDAGVLLRSLQATRGPLPDVALLAADPSQARRPAWHDGGARKGVTHDPFDQQLRDGGSKAWAVATARARTHSLRPPTAAKPLAPNDPFAPANVRATLTTSGTTMTTTSLGSQARHLTARLGPGTRAGDPGVHGYARAFSTSTRLAGVARAGGADSASSLEYRGAPDAPVVLPVSDRLMPYANLKAKHVMRGLPTATEADVALLATSDVHRPSLNSTSNSNSNGKARGGTRSLSGRSDGWSQASRPLSAQERRLTQLSSRLLVPTDPMAARTLAARAADLRQSQLVAAARSAADMAGVMHTRAGVARATATGALVTPAASAGAGALLTMTLATIPDSEVVEVRDRAHADRASATSGFSARSVALGSSRVHRAGAEGGPRRAARGGTSGAAKEEDQRSLASKATGFATSALARPRLPDFDNLMHAAEDADALLAAFGGARGGVGPAGDGAPLLLGRATPGAGAMDASALLPQTGTRRRPHPMAVPFVVRTAVGIPQNPEQLMRTRK